METRIDEPAYAIDVDIACSRCGYNLRGLDSGGRCPECGTAVGVSLVSHVEHRRGAVSIRREDSAWLGWLVRGCYALLAAMVIWVLLQVVPDSWADYPSKARWLMTPAAFAGWGLTWLGIMMLSSRPASAISEHAGDRALRWSVRVSVTLYTAIPLVMTLLQSGRGWANLGSFQGPMVIFLGMFATVAFYLLMRSLALRIPSITLAILFLTMSYMIVLVCMVGVSDGSDPFYYRRAPLDVFLKLPSPVFGEHEYFHSVIMQRRWRYWPNFHPIRMLVASAPLLTTGCLLWFMFRVRGRLRELKKAGDPKTAAPE